jgi:hypothetical protein
MAKLINPSFTYTRCTTQRQFACNQKAALWRLLKYGQYQTRTDDILLVRQALYQLS